MFDIYEFPRVLLCKKEKKYDNIMPYRLHKNDTNIDILLFSHIFSKSKKSNITKKKYIQSTKKNKTKKNNL